MFFICFINYLALIISFTCATMLTIEHYNTWQKAKKYAYEINLLETYWKIKLTWKKSHHNSDE